MFGLFGPLKGRFITASLSCRGLDLRVRPVYIQVWWTSFQTWTVQTNTMAQASRSQTHSLPQFFTMKQDTCKNVPYMMQILFYEKAKRI